MRLFVAVWLSEEMKAALLKAQDSLFGALSSLPTKSSPRRKSHSNPSESGRLGPRDDLSISRQESLHLTVKFLGEVGKQNLEPLKIGLSTLQKTVHGFTLLAKGVGIFPEQGKPRVIWAGLEEVGVRPSAEVRQLSSLVSQCELVGESIGVPREDRPFSPHITLARVRNVPPNIDLRSIIAWIKVPPATQIVKEVALVESVLKTHGPKYTILETYTLA